MLFRHATGVWRRHGLLVLLQQVIKQLKRQAGRYSPGFYDYQYAAWQRTQGASPTSYQHSQTPLVSILVPVYNVEQKWLREMVESVVGQSYDNWQLCLVNDNASDAHVQPMLDRFAADDQRIRVHHQTANQGIAGASARALEMAGGEWIALLDHDDCLASHALDRLVHTLNQQPEADLVYSDEDKIDSGGNPVSPFFKPDYSPELLRCQNYFGHLLVLSRSLMGKAGNFRDGFNGAQDYDLVLRAVEQAQCIVHIPEVLYHWRQIPGSTAAIYGEKNYAWEAGRKALQQHLDRTGLQATAEQASVPGTYRVRYPLVNQPLVSVIIPFRDQPALLDQCLHALLQHTSWQPLEILAVDNQSSDAGIDHLKKTWSAREQRIRFIEFDQPFNFSAICNAAVEQANGDYIVLMNNDIEIASDGWLENLLRYAQQPQIGAVGAMLRYPDSHIQHAGIVVGIGGTAGHPFKHFDPQQIGYFGRLKITSNVSAVTGALMMTSKQKYQQAGGLDEQQFGIALNDVDFCLTLLQAGYRNVVTADVTAVHHESRSRGLDTSTVNSRRLEKESRAFQQKWQALLAAGDPFYNPNLTLDSEDYRLRGI